MLRDWRTAPIPETEKALFALVEKVNRDSTSVRPEDLDAARAAGWSDEALYDALTVCALFNFYNIWVDASGVRDMPTEAYRMSGERLAEHGYAPEAETGGSGPGAGHAGSGPAGEARGSPPAAGERRGT